MKERLIRRANTSDGEMDIDESLEEMGVTEEKDRKSSKMKKIVNTKKKSRKKKNLLNQRAQTKIQSRQLPNLNLTNQTQFQKNRKRESQKCYQIHNHQNLIVQILLKKEEERKKSQNQNKWYILLMNPQVKLIM